MGDANGYELGHPDVPVVGHYMWRDTTINVHLNTETMEIINIWDGDNRYL